MLKKQLLYYILFFVTLHIVAQMATDTTQNKETIHFKGFGVNPTGVNFKLLKKIKVATNFEQKAEAILELTDFHSDKGNLDSIVYYGKYLYNESLNTAKSHPKAAYYLAISTNIIANGKRKKGLMDDALKWYIKGVSLAKELGDKKLINKQKFGIGMINVSRKKYAKALITYDKCLSNTDDKYLKHDIYKSKGDLYLVQKKYNKAKFFYNKAITFFRIEKKWKKELEVTLQLGVIAENVKNNKQAFQYYNKVKNKAEEKGYYDLYFRAQNRIGRLYYLFKEYENAIMVLNTAYSNAMQWDNLEYQQRILKNLKRVFLAKKDYKNAYAVSTQSERLSNQILKNQNKKEVNELEIQYKTLQKENEIKRQKLLKVSFLIGFLIILIPIIALLYTYYQKLQTQSKLNRTQEEVNKQKVATLQKEQELKLTKAAIEGQDKERKRIAQELHDSIGGSLAGIKLQLSSIAQNDKNYKRIVKQIDDTYHQVRDISHTLIPQKFKDNKFTDLINHYIENFQKDTGTQLTFSSHPKEEINAIAETLKVALYKIIQELITNTFKHAKAKKVNIHLNKYSDTINLIFEDNGIGFDIKNSKKGIGLTNMKSRINTLNGTINIDSYPNRGTVININIPLK